MACRFVEDLFRGGDFKYVLYSPFESLANIIQCDVNMFQELNGLTQGPRILTMHLKVFCFGWKKGRLYFGMFALPAAEGW